MAITPEQARINGQKGGRPVGAKNKLTLERDVVFEAWRQRTYNFINNLQDSQMTLARGQMFLYRIDKEYVMTGKGKGFWRKMRPVQVQDEEEIRNFIEGEADGTNPVEDSSESGSAYYYITAKEPSNQAIDSMLDRAGGKAVATTQIQGAGGGPLEIKIVKYGGDNPTSPVQPS